MTKLVLPELEEDKRGEVFSNTVGSRYEVRSSR